MDCISSDINIWCVWYMCVAYGTLHGMFFMCVMCMMGEQCFSAPLFLTYFVFSQSLRSEPGGSPHILPCVSCLPAAVIKHPHKSSWRERGRLLLHIPRSRQSRVVRKSWRLLTLDDDGECLCSAHLFPLRGMAPHALMGLLASVALIRTLELINLTAQLS